MRELERRDPGRELVSFTGVPVAVEEQTARELERALEGSGDRNLIGWGWTAYRHARQVQVPAELRRDLVVGAGKPAWCFEVACAYVLHHADQPVTLVHGWVFEEGYPFSHAWAELPGGVVYDPSSGRFYDQASYYQVLQPLPLAVYPADQVVARYQQTGQPGPWAEYNTAHDTLAEEWIGHIEAQHPGLEQWINAMLAADAAFAGVYRRLVLANALAALHIHGHLARHPQRWQHHQPGRRPWPWPVHPLGDFDHPEQPHQRSTLR